MPVTSAFGTDGSVVAAAVTCAALLVAAMVRCRNCSKLAGQRPQTVQLLAEASGCARLDWHRNGSSTRRGLRLVCISDTHGHHRELELPAGDVLIHAGDFTLHGKEEQARDFNAWLGEQPHRTKLVVLGNHENNSGWNKSAAELLSNATLLRQSGCHVKVKGSEDLRVFGTDFFWPCPSGNPNFAEIPLDTDVLIAHGPALGCADGGRGCPSLLEAVQRIKPELVVSGHVHFARGAASLQLARGGHGPTILLNAANCGSGKLERALAGGPIIVDI
ncbi:unnamed protein product [Polarella glacialis]|uniref:Calcineurin-like phosphoesterase domain-containing protein n=1 Tax=Polarella glacialis TaxID=89957 RepID=A0A813HMS5_POLGL|nr:unnamed protein product [Polarella glacialis]